MTEPAPPPLDDDLRALLARTAGVEPAPAAARARVRARVEASVGSAGTRGGAEGGAGGHDGARAAQPDLAAPAGLARRLLPLAISFALGGGVGGLVVARILRVPAPEAPRVVYVDRPVPAPAGTSLAETAAPPATERAPASRAHRAAAAAQNPIQVERRLLDVARGALERGQPGAALDATAKHERAFPDGVLVQEREAIAIRALAMLGRRPEARGRAARFHARFPDSVLWPAISTAVGASPAP